MSWQLTVIQLTWHCESLGSIPRLQHSAELHTLDAVDFHYLNVPSFVHLFVSDQGELRFVMGLTILLVHREPDGTRRTGKCSFEVPALGLVWALALHRFHLDHIGTSFWFLRALKTSTLLADLLWLPAIGAWLECKMLLSELKVVVIFLAASSRTKQILDSHPSHLGLLENHWDLEGLGYLRQVFVRRHLYRRT